MSDREIFEGPSVRKFNSPADDHIVAELRPVSAAGHVDHGNGGVLVAFLH